MNSIKVSVIMSVYNCEPYLSEAIDSILAQTFKEWELLICDDCSEDDTWQIIHGYKNRYPDRIFAVRNRRNRKQGYSRNRCIRSARGKYIAVMDGDDRCSPDRLEKQYQFLEAHPEYVVVGTAMSIFDEQGLWGESVPKAEIFPEDTARGCPFIGASCMFRRSVLLKLGGYRDQSVYYTVEDRELFQRVLLAGYRGANLPDKLYQYREYRAAMDRRDMGHRIRGARLTVKMIRRLRLPVYYYRYAVFTIAAGLLPQGLYRYLHRRKYGQRHAGGKE